MRIICESFHDYYDSVQSQGQDLSLVYLRTPKEFEKQEAHAIVSKFPYLKCYSVHELTISTKIIGFCGKIYPLVELDRFRQWPFSRQHAFCYTLEDVDAFIERNFKKKQVEAYNANKRDFPYQHWSFSNRREAFEKFFAESEKQKDKFRDIFLKYHVPIFVAGSHSSYPSKDTFALNVALKPLEFYRIMDTFTAFQEIQMFLGGLAVPLKEIPTIPDKVMVEAKGFDKFSFRKDKKE
jgi:hypothetical protein